jgi:hypothetical protein
MHVRVANGSPRPRNQPPVFVRAVSAEREDASMEGLNCEMVSRVSLVTNTPNELTSDASLELVCPPEDGR